MTPWGGRHRGLLAPALAVALLGLAAWSCVFTVPPSRQAVVTRFGAPVRDLLPGLHFKLPAPIERVVSAPGPQASLVMPVGYRIVDEQAGLAPPPRMMQWLTGDANIVEVRANVLYRVVDVRRWLFGVSPVHDLADGSYESPEFALRRLAEAALTERCAELGVHDALVGATTALAQDTRDAIQRRADELGLGVAVARVQLLHQAPLRAVAADFVAVQDARTHGERTIQSAESQRQAAVSRARRERERALQEAEAEAQRLVRAAEAERTAFEELHGAVGALDSPAGRRFVSEGIMRLLQGARVDTVQPGTAEHPTVYTGTRPR